MDKVHPLTEAVARILAAQSPNATYGELANAAIREVLTFEPTEKMKMDWQPIETAPRDGTPILIAGGTFFYDQETYITERPFAGVDIAAWRRDGWCGGYGAEYDGEYWHKPTHWMPLPPPPKDT